MQHGDEHGPEPYAIAAPKRSPWYPRRLETFSPPHQLGPGWHPDLVDWEAGEQSRQPARVVGIGVGQREGREPSHAEPSKDGQDHALAPIGAPWAAPTGVDQEPSAIGTTHEDRLPLTDVENEHAEMPVGTGGPRGERQRGDGEDPDEHTLVSSSGDRP
jgi:hypothetical protein